MHFCQCRSALLVTQGRVDLSWLIINKLFWLSLVSGSTQWNIFAYNLEKNICLPPQECIHWLLKNFFHSFIHFRYKKGLIYTLVDRIFKINKTTSGVKQDFKNLSNAIQFNSIPSYLTLVTYKTCLVATSRWRWLFCAE